MITRQKKYLQSLKTSYKTMNWEVFVVVVVVVVVALFCFVLRCVCVCGVCMCVCVCVCVHRGMSRIEKLK